MELYQNPIQKNGDFADPFVLRYNGTYYLYCTNPDTRCWSSQNLIHWTLEGATVPEEEFPGLVPFAPEVVYWNGAFYMYTSPHGFGHYVLKSDSPTGPFRKITENVGHAIDFSVFIDDDGQWYAYWADDHGILGCKMPSPTTFGEPVYIGADLHGWTEGPFVVKQAGKYHLTYTGNHFLSKGYRIHAAIADSPLGPYRDDPFNPVIVRTEGDVVGLGHSSTALGPDLQSHYIFYHNLNPDKTRDLNLDRVVFSPEKAYILGPTVTGRPVPTLPGWQRLRRNLQTAEPGFSEGIRLPEAGALEVHLAAGKETNCYGVMFPGKGLRLEFNRAENTLSLLENAGLLAKKSLFPEYDHGALHCIRAEYGTGLTVFLDNLLWLEAAVSPEGSDIRYFGDGAVNIGTATVHSRAPVPGYPVPGVVPGDRAVCVDVPETGDHQIIAMGYRGAQRCMLVDDVPLEPVQMDDANGVAIFRSSMEAGKHTLNPHGLCPETMMVAPYAVAEHGDYSLGKLGPYGKVHTRRMWADGTVHARWHMVPDETHGQSGVILRGSRFADGGEGDDPRLGTNFFVGYRVCVTEGALQLWKHRYDETLLAEVPMKWKEFVELEITVTGNIVSVKENGDVLLEYRDKRPIPMGYAGFHVRNCTITDAELYEIQSLP